jgi:proteasome lid subunit RPN8/RPN11
VNLRISAADLAAIASEAARADPQECCGLLVGLREAAEITVQSIVPAANIAREPRRRFEVDPKALFDTHRAARAAGHEVIGHYHSHPGGAAVPSAHDQDRAQAAGELWLIVPVSEAGAGMPQAHLFTGDGFEEVEITTAS